MESFFAECKNKLVNFNSQKNFLVLQYDRQTILLQLVSHSVKTDFIRILYTILIVYRMHWTTIYLKKGECIFFDKLHLHTW